VRILAVADVHGSARAAKMIRAHLANYKPDVFVAAGDLTNFGPVMYAEELLHGLAVPTLAVPGNCDPPEILKTFDRLAVNLHARRTVTAEHTFVGIGGANPTPFGTPFELSEPDIENTLRQVMEPRSILVSHAPPNGYVDVVHSGAHVGSTAIRTVIEEFEPRLVLCGHIHEGRGIAHHGRTTIVNVGPAMEGHSALVEINGDVRVDLM